MSETFYVKHNFQESRKEKIFLSYQITHDTAGEEISEDLRGDIVNGESSVLEKQFRDDIIEKLSNGETEGSLESEIDFTISGEEISVVVVCEWKIGFGDYRTASFLGHEHIEEYEFSAEKDVEVEITVSCNDDSEEEADNVNLEGAKDYIESDIMSEVEDSDEYGSMNFNFDGLDYSVDWKLY